MSRQESDKEDLIAEASGLFERAEYDAIILGRSSLVTAGFRRNGFLSLYFEQDPFFQFDEMGRLRRSYSDGFLYRSQPPTLVQLDRNRSVEGQTRLMRTDLSENQCAEFRERMRRFMGEFVEQWQAQRVQRLRLVAEDAKQFEQRLFAAIEIALAVEDDSWLSDSINKRRMKS